MFLTLNMGLRAWDQGNDEYDHAELANNWTAVDQHDHTTGKGVRIPSGGLADGAVTSVKIAPNAVTPDKIPDGSLTQAELAPDSVGSVQIQPNAVGNSELQDGSVTPSKLDPDFLPVGTVISWYRPTSTTPFPAGGWEVCDGRAWSTITNTWGVTAGNIPDLRGKFILGAGLSNIGNGPTNYPDIGMVGGSHTKNLSHSHTVTAHSHSLPAHTHTIQGDGDHTHGISDDGAHNHSMHSRLNALLQQIQVYSWDTSDNPMRRDNNLQSLYVAGFNNLTPDDAVPSTGNHSHSGATASAGGHTHGGVTGVSSGTSGNGTAATDSQLSSAVDIRPAYVGLIYLMRVR
jgi:hypothetical protein